MRTKVPEVVRLYAAGAVGAVVGLLVGGRVVKTYDWRTEWFIPASVPLVYEAMTSREALRQWWPSMELVDEDREDKLRVGSSVGFRVHQAPEVARLALPHPLRLHRRRARAAAARGRHGRLERCARGSFPRRAGTIRHARDL